MSSKKIRNIRVYMKINVYNIRYFVKVHREKEIYYITNGWNFLYEIMKVF